MGSKSFYEVRKRKSGAGGDGARGKMGIKRTKIPLIWSLWNFTGACGGDVIPPGFINKPLFHVKTGKEGIRAKRGSRQRGDPGKVPGPGCSSPSLLGKQERKVRALRIFVGIEWNWAQKSPSETFKTFPRGGEGLVADHNKN